MNLDTITPGKKNVAQKMGTPYIQQGERGQRGGCGHVIIDIWHSSLDLTQHCFTLCLCTWLRVPSVNTVGVQVYVYTYQPTS